MTKTTTNTKTNTSQVGFEVKKNGKLIQFVITVDPTTGTATAKGALSIPLPYNTGYGGSPVISAELDGLTYSIYGAKALYVKETPKPKTAKAEKTSKKEVTPAEKLALLERSIQYLDKRSKEYKEVQAKIAQLALEV